VPEGQTLQPVFGQLHVAPAAGGDVVIHCRAGIGQASLVAGALLIGEGLAP
jgi:protein-tyrosine phosphatase